MIRSSILLLLVVVIQLVHIAIGIDEDSVISEGEVPLGFTLGVFADNLKEPRGLVVTSTGEILVVERGRNAVVALWDNDYDGKADGRADVAILSNNDELTHGLAIHGEFIYASSDKAVYRWPYVPGQRTTGDEPPVEVIVNINEDGNGGAPKGHWTRTLSFGPHDGRLYVSIGSYSNIDESSYRARIRSFDISGVTVDNKPLDFSAGLIVADGLRNTVGLSWDDEGILWGVNNGPDQLNRPDLGLSIYNDNPAEELNRINVSIPALDYGYPYCWTEGSLPEGIGKGPGTVWAWPTTMKTERDDDWCRKNTIPAALTMQAHSAPLGIAFVTNDDIRKDNNRCSDNIEPFPSSFLGDAIVAFHGSWNRDIPTGYKVVRIPFGGDGMPTGEVLDFVRHGGVGAKWPSGIRPVDVAFDRCGRIIVSSDGTRISSTSRSEGVILMVTANNTTTHDEPLKVKPDSNSAISNTLGVCRGIVGASLVISVLLVMIS